MTSIAKTDSRPWIGPMALSALAMLALAAHQANAQQIATDIVIVNNDGPGEGLNDPTPAAPVGGNTGRTLGEQRLVVFEAAARVWESVLVSAVPIEVSAQFDELFCTAETAVLGSAGPNSAFSDFPGARLANTIYVGAQANQQAGVDLDPEDPDLRARFNSLIGTDPDCLGGASFHLGIDGRPAPRGTISLFDTVLHEMAHGLGFTSLVDEETGEKLAGIDDIFSRFLEDDTLGQPWPLLTDEERVQSAINTGSLQWSGEIARLCAGRVLEDGAAADGDVLMYAPTPVEPGSSVSHFDTSILPDELMEPSATATSIIDLTVAAFADMGWPVSQAAAARLCREPLQVAAD